MISEYLNCFLNSYKIESDDKNNGYVSNINPPN